MLNRFGPFSSKLFLFIVLTLTTSCGDYNKHITGNYYLTDFQGEKSLTLKLDSRDFIDVVNASVVEIGYDANFIIVKQHPQEFSYPANRSITNYFIIPLKFKMSGSKELNVLGPLTEKEFNKKKKDLKVSESLTRIIVDNP